MRQASRIWVFLGVLGVMATIAFGLLTGTILQGASGTIMLGVFGLSMLYIAWVLRHGRYTDYADEPDAEAKVGPEHAFPPSWAPPLLALAVAMFAVGVRFSPVLMAVGGILGVLTIFSWIVQRVDLLRLQHADHVAHAAPLATADRPAGAAATDQQTGAHEQPGSPGLGPNNA